MLAHLAGAAGHRAVDPQREAEPGKIVHECRRGRDGGAGRGPLRPLLRQRRRHPAVRGAGPRLLTSAPADLDFIARAVAERRRRRWTGSTTYGDRDGDGFVEYARADARRAAAPGLEGQRRCRLPQRRHAGRAAHRPVRGAGLRLRRLAGGGRAGRRPWATAPLAGQLRTRARATCATASSRPSGARTWAPSPSPSTARSVPAGCARSNPGQCLWTGIVTPERRAPGGRDVC